MLLEQLDSHGDWLADTEYIGSRVAFIEELYKLLDVDGG